LHIQLTAAASIPFIQWPWEKKKKTHTHTNKTTNKKQKIRKKKKKLTKNLKKKYQFQEKGNDVNIRSFHLFSANLTIFPQILFPQHFDRTTCQSFQLELKKANFAN
jgi:hypothetical protein